jgi:hypothetical protein
MRALLFVALLSSTASAGTYLGLGIGTAPSMSVSNSTQDTTEASNGRSGKLLVGFRLGRLSIEGAGGRYGMFLNHLDSTSTMLSAALKFSLPLGNNFEVFGRGGLERTWLSSNSPYDANGNGYLLGAGLEYRLDLAVVGGSVFVDYERTSTSLTNNEMAKFDSVTGVWSAGVTLSL